MYLSRLLPILIISHFATNISWAVEQQSPVNKALQQRPTALLDEKRKARREQQRPRQMIEQRTGITQNHLTTQQVGNKTVVSGAIINHGNVTTVGDETANAVGANIEIENKDNVLVNAVMVQHGDVTASAVNNKNAAAQAVGARVSIKGARKATVNVRSVVHGNITANATGSGTVDATAVSTQIKSDANYQNIEVNSTSGAAIRAIAQGQ